MVANRGDRGNPRRKTAKKKPKASKPRLNRTTFETSRFLDFCTERELTAQIGHDPEDYQHLVHDPPTDLSLHKNSPGYRLILNNILFPAARKKERKT